MENRSRSRDLLFLGIAAAIVLTFAVLPVPDGLSRSAMTLLGIFFASVMLWIAVGISWPSLFCLLALLLLPEISAASLIGMSVGNPVFTFLVFTFCCSHALDQTCFTRRCALWLLSSRPARRGPWQFLILYFLSVLLLGSCMSTTVICVIYLTINEEIFALLKLKKGDRFAALMTMGLIITASISGAMTPLAHVFPIMALSLYRGLTGVSIGYTAYMAAGIPAALLSVSAMLLIFRFVLRPDTSVARGLDIDALKASLRPADRREKLTVGVFFLVVALWILPDLLKGVLPGAMGWVSGLGTAVPPLLGTLLLCVLHEDGRPLLKFADGLRSVPWPSLFMAAAALALGAAMSNDDIGLSKAMGGLLVPLTNSVDGLLLVFLLLLAAALMTNIGSNMVTVTVVCTVALPIVLALGERVNAAALAAALGMMSTYAFATPPAMTTVVLGTGSGWTTNAQMARYGFLILAPCVLFVTLVAYPVAALLM